MPRSLLHKEVLNNGIRVVTEEIPFVKSVSMGIWVEVGSRDEGDGEAGLSHFIEHMMFKGTARRSASGIAREIDHLGGELNAFTSRENTAYYAKVTDDQVPPAIDLLADLFRYSTFSPSEIKLEKQVILEEIHMVEDDPEDQVHDLHTENVWRGNSLSRPILGEPRTVRGVTRLQIRDFLERQYRPERIVIAAAGRFNRRELIRRIERAFRSHGLPARASGQPSEGGRRMPINGGRRLLIRRKSFEQTHLCLGLPGLSITHPDRYAAHALNTLLGGGMSSRLFQEVREKRGLVYTIYSHLAGYQDAGMLMVYAASRPEMVSKVLKLTLQELRKVRDRGIRGEEMDRAVNQLKGGIMLGLESTNSRMSRIARDEIYFGRLFSLQETLDEIAGVSRAQVRRLAGELLDLKRLSVTLLGPVPQKASRLERLLDA